MQVQHENNTVVKDNTHDRCLVRGSQVSWKVRRALSAELSCKGGVTNTIYLSTVPYTTSRILTSTSKVKLIIYVDEIVYQWLETFYFNFKVYTCKCTHINFQIYWYCFSSLYCALIHLLYILTPFFAKQKLA